jgi:Fungal Zn(2)-Cys(6) binuclear cluster domain
MKDVSKYSQNRNWILVSLKIMSARPIYSCQRCAGRKVKCDRQNPCSACVKHKVECVYQTLQSLEKRPKRVKYQILVDRIRHYEALLQAHGIDPSNNQDSLAREKVTGVNDTGLLVPTDSTRSFVFKPGCSSDEPHVVQSQGRSKFVEK